MKRNHLKSIQSLLLFTLCFISVNVIAQDYIKTGNQAWELGKYKTAVNNFSKVENILENKSLLAKRGLGYFKLNQLSKAINDFTLSKKLGNNDVDLFFLMAQTKQHLKEYEEAAFFYKEYLREAGDKSQKGQLALRELKNCVYGSFHKQDVSTAFIESFGDDVNTYYDEIYPIQSPGFGNTFYFTSNRSLKDNDVYAFSINEKGAWVEEAFLVRGINTKANEYVMDVSPDAQSMLFNKTQGKEVSTQIYVSSYDTTGQQHIIQLPEYLLDGAVDLQIVDRNTIAFASKELGGYGGYDIFTINYKNGVWSDPLNEGEIINTAYDERSPYFASSAEYLYFSSNRPYCYGGFDIYYYNKLGIADAPTNMGAPINGSGNELNFRLNIDGQMAVMSSDRKTGAGAYDIYQVYLQQFKPMPSKDMAQLEYLVDYFNYINPKEEVSEVTRTHLDQLKEKLADKLKEETDSTEAEDKVSVEPGVEVADIPEKKEEEIKEEVKEEVVTKTTEQETTKEKETVAVVEKEEVVVAVEPVVYTEPTVIEGKKEEKTEKLTPELADEVIPEVIIEVIPEVVTEASGDIVAAETPAITPAPKTKKEKRRDKKKAKEKRAKEKLAEENRAREKKVKEKKAEESKAKEEVLVTKPNAPTEPVTPVVVNEPVKTRKKIPSALPQKESGESPLATIKKERLSINSSAVKVILGENLENTVLYQDRHDLMNKVNIAKIDKLVIYLKANLDHSVHFIAHTDHLELGLPEYMQYNTLKRANLLSRYLMENGIGMNRISIESVCSNYPFVKPDLAGVLNTEYLAYNKRVDWEILNADQLIVNSHNLKSTSVPGYAVDRKYELYTLLKEELYYSVEIAKSEHIYKNAILRLYNDLYIRRYSPTGDNFYYIGLYPKYEDALALQKNLSESSADYAKIVPFFNGQKIEKSQLKELAKDYPDLEKYLSASIK